MSEVNTTVPQAGFVKPVGWTAGRIRRVRLFAFGALVAVAAGLGSLTLPWYAFSVAGPAHCSPGAHPQTVTVVSASNVHIPGVAGAGCITGYQTVHQDELLAAAGVSPTSSAYGGAAAAPAPSSELGIPSTAFFLAIGGLLVAASTLLRNGFPGLLGLLALTVSWNAFGGLQQTMTWGVGGQLNAPQLGLSLYEYALTFLVGCSALGCGWLAWINHTERAEAKRTARAEGREHELPPSFLDHLAATALRTVQQKADRVAEARAPHDKAAA